MKLRRPGALVAIAILALVSLGACSSSGSSGSAEPTKTATGGVITVGAFDIHFDVGVIKASPGPLTVTLDNHGGMEHTFQIKGTSLLLRANSGKSATGSVTLTKGTYDFQCTIPGHAQQGMKGKVEVS